MDDLDSVKYIPRHPVRIFLFFATTTSSFNPLDRFWGIYDLLLIILALSPSLFGTFSVNVGFLSTRTREKREEKRKPTGPRSLNVPPIGLLQFRESRASVET